MPHSGRFAGALIDHSNRKSRCHPRGGPVWVNINWLLITGLEEAGYQLEAERLEERTLELIFENGFWEYYDPRTGRGLGCGQFSWTAAAALDLCRRWEREQGHRQPGLSALINAKTSAQRFPMNDWAGPHAGPTSTRPRVLISHQMAR